MTCTTDTRRGSPRSAGDLPPPISLMPRLIDQRKHRPRSQFVFLALDNGRIEMPEVDDRIRRDIDIVVKRCELAYSDCGTIKNRRYRRAGNLIPHAFLHTSVETGRALLILADVVKHDVSSL